MWRVHLARSCRADEIESSGLGWGCVGAALFSAEKEPNTTERTSLRASSARTVMAGSTLLEEKTAPLPKALQAIGVGIVIAGSIFLFLSELSNELENHFHIWNHTAQQAEELQQEFKSHPALLLGLLALFPLSAIAGIVMVLPLGVYITDHAAFRALSPYRCVLNPSASQSQVAWLSLT